MRTLASVQIIGSAQQLKSFLLYNLKGELMQFLGVGFQMDYASGNKKFAITLQKHRRSEPLIGLFGLGVTEGNPNLGNFRRSKQRIDKLYPGAQKSHI